MQRWVVVSLALVALARADDCPDGGRCEHGHTCCSDPVSGYECCPFHQAACCEDHMHCCPEGTVCDSATSSCTNATVSLRWAERVSADQTKMSKSFRMIKAYMGEEDDNVCPDQSRCPPEFSCLRALTKFGCCPLAQGVPCPDGKHCCAGGHQCSSDSRSCITKDSVDTVLCGDGEMECPEETTCCQTPDGSWGCCPMPKAVCCEDEIHCCPKGSTCDVKQLKCVSASTKKEMPMWAKLPARKIAAWENQKEREQVTAESVHDEETEEVPESTTESTVPPFTEEEVTASTPTTAPAGNDVPCNDTVACEDGSTCCKTKEGGWACCPLPEAVCCDDLIHCCPHGKKCNLAAETCDDPLTSVAWVEKVPTIPRQRSELRDISCDQTHSCPDETTCCKTTAGNWSCCALPEAVCCEDHIHCCPAHTTCDLATLTCDGPAGPVPMEQKVPATTTVAPTTTETTTQSQVTEEEDSEDDEVKKAEEEDSEDDEVKKAEEVDSEDKEVTKAEEVDSKGEEVTKAQEEGSEDKEVMKAEEVEEEEGKEDHGGVQCDPHTKCPRGNTCCFMTSYQRWGCCPLPMAVCCADGNHCCPIRYKCEVATASCIRGDVVIPWYAKHLAIAGIEDEPGSVECDGRHQCPERSTCCRLFTGEWGCCPLPQAVCCADMEHCCPQGYSCNMDTNSCQKVILLQLETVPLTPVYLLERVPQSDGSKEGKIQCDDQTFCENEQTCCRTSQTMWGCCPAPNAVCCSDMKHCCPAGHQCTTGGGCVQSTGLHWDNWHVFLTNKKRALLV